jgi:hypothetical protein
MQKRLPKLMSAGMLLLLMFSLLAAIPVGAYCAPGGIGLCGEPYEPVWVTLNALPQGNYPGGNEIFDVAVVNSGQPAAGNVTLFNETVGSPQLPPSSSNPNHAIGLPVTLTSGQLIVNTIAMEIPSNFTQNNFTAILATYVSYWNGTLNVPLKLTGNLVVHMLSLPLTGTQTTATSGAVSSSLFALGVGIPSIVVVILLVLLARGKGGPKGGG